MVKVQEWLDQNYPKEERNNITELRIRRKNLEGHLDLQDFVNLEFLDCSQNQLTSLGLSKNVKLEVVNIYDNRISCTEYARLSIFSHLVNLQKLDLGFNTDKQLQESKERNSLEQIVQQRGRYPRRTGGSGYLLGELTLTKTNESEKSYNDFSGSLEMLKNCQKLKELSIEGQKNITGKLENLPSSVETFDWKETFFKEELENFGYSRNLEILRLTRKNEELENTIKEERKLHEWGKRQKQELLDKIKNQAAEIIKLTQENKLLKEQQNSQVAKIEIPSKK